jgi:hypothetical protein
MALTPVAAPPPTAPGGGAPAAPLGDEPATPPPARPAPIVPPELSAQSGAVLEASRLVHDGKVDEGVAVLVTAAGRATPIDHDNLLLMAVRTELLANQLAGADELLGKVTSQDPTVQQQVAELRARIDRERNAATR